MNAQWKQVGKKLLVKTTVWLLTELVLNMAGLDDLANYGEFVFGREMTNAYTPAASIVLTLA
jgi:hypothetical protein